MVKEKRQAIKFALRYNRFKEIKDISSEVLHNKKIQK